MQHISSFILGLRRIKKLWWIILYLIFVLVFGQLVVSYVTTVRESMRNAVKQDMENSAKLAAASISHFFTGRIHSVLFLSECKAIKDFFCNTPNGQTARIENEANHYIIDLLKTMDTTHSHLSSSDVRKFQERVPTPSTERGAFDADESLPAFTEINWLAGIEANFLFSAGKVRDETTPEPDTYITVRRPWYEGIQRADDTDEVVVTDIYSDIKYKIPCLSIVKLVTVTDENGKLWRGIVGSDLFLHSIPDIMRHSESGGVSAILVDNKQVVVYKKDRVLTHGYTLSQVGKGYDQIAHLLDKSDSGSAILSINDEECYVAYSRIRVPNSHWSVILIGQKERMEFTGIVYFQTYSVVFVLGFLVLCSPIVFFAAYVRYQNSALLKARTVADNANMAKGEFLANMSHEIRTPMNGVLGITEILSNTAPLTALQKQYIETIQQSANSLLTVINDILDFSKIEAGRLTIDMTEANLRAVIEDVAETIAIKLRQSGVHFVLYVAPTIQGLFRCDPIRVRQVFLNILGNAAKFTEYGEIFVRVTVDQHEDSHWTIRFEISDTGIGIPEDKIQFIFQAFIQADSSTARRFGGTGLGLSISRRLVEMMGGSIGVRSVVGKGSTFWFTLPFESLDSGAVTTSSVTSMMSTISKPIGEEFLGAGKHVVLYDVQPNSMSAAKDLLQYWGITTELYQNPDALFERLSPKRLAEVPVDLVFFSEDKTYLSVESFSEKFRELVDDYHLKFVHVYPLGDTVAATKNNIPGSVGLISKPIRLNTLERIIRNIFLDTRANSDSDSVSAQDFSGLSQQSLSILLAEDVRVNVIVATTILKNMGHRVDVAENGIVALKKLQQNNYDIVLMDCQMPEMDGYDCTRKLRQSNSGVKNPSIPVIAMTAHAMVGDREKCIQAGMNDYISKPIDMESVAKVIARWQKKKT